MKNLFANSTALLALLAGGCGSTPQSDQAPASSNAPGHITIPTGDVLRERLTGSNNGLEVRRWTVSDPGNASLAVLAQYADGAATDEAATERLRQNGLRFVRVPAAEVDVIVEQLGGATMDRNEWHGQIPEWRSLREQPIDERGTAVAIDGRVRRFDRGEFRLLVRSWTVMMEDGPNMHVEVLPQHRLPTANNMRRLLGEKAEDAGEPFPSLALDLQLQAGYAYVLVSESPNVDWPQLDAPADAASPVLAMEQQPTRSDGSDKAAALTPPSSKAVRQRVGPDDPVGPEAGAPRTLGEVLLPAYRNPPSREILVFVPKIPVEFYPPIYPSDLKVRLGGNAAGGGSGGGGR